MIDNLEIQWRGMCGARSHTYLRSFAFLKVVLVTGAPKVYTLQLAWSRIKYMDTCSASKKGMGRDCNDETRV